MKIVNSNFRGILTSDRNLESITKTYNCPHWGIYKTNGYTVLFFKGNKCRLMGSTSIPNNIPFDIQFKSLQSMTITHDLCKSINLIDLSKRTRCIYEPEIFPCLQLLDYKPLCCNVFASSKLVLTGVRNIEQATKIIKHVQSII